MIKLSINFIIWFKYPKSLFNKISKINFQNITQFSQFTWIRNSPHNCIKVRILSRNWILNMLNDPIVAKTKTSNFKQTTLKIRHGQSGAIFFTKTLWHNPTYAQKSKKYFAWDHDANTFIPLLLQVGRWLVKVSQPYIYFALLDSYNTPSFKHMT